MIYRFTHCRALCLSEEMDGCDTGHKIAPGWTLGIWGGILATRVSKSGPVLVFCLFWNNCDHDWSQKIPEMEKTGLELLMTGFFRSSMVCNQLCDWS